MRFLLLLLFTLVYSSEQVFVACEGNYYQSNGSIWTIENGEAYSYPENPLGQVVQSMHVEDNKLYVIVNVPGSIQVFDITRNGLIPSSYIDTQGSGPREMVVVGEYLYFTNWYTADVKKLNLSTMQIENQIMMPGLPEDIIFHNGELYVSIIMNNDWSDGDKVVAISLDNDTITSTYSVGLGPSNLLVDNGDIYIARTYYDETWNAFYGTSKINSNGSVIENNYGAGLACGGSVHSLNGSVYRSFNGGVAQLDEALNIIENTRIGDYGFDNVYSVEVLDDNIYFGLSDYSAPDQVVVIDISGDELANYEVGAIPGDFAIWKGCFNDGDVNSDGILNITDIVISIYYILDDAPYNCEADINADGSMNIIDIVVVTQQILQN